VPDASGELVTDLLFGYLLEQILHDYDSINFKGRFKGFTGLI